MSGMVRGLGWAVLALCLATGCGDVDSPGGGDGGSGGKGDGGSGGSGGGGSGGGGDVPSLGPIEWTQCSYQGVQHECAEVEVPLDWSDASSERISFFLRRVAASPAATKGQLWLLEGGPGFAGESFVPFAAFFNQLGFDVYIPDYRGTGHSTPLVCEGEEGRDTSPACKEEIVERYGDDLRFFSTTDAALDIGKAIDAVRGEDEKVFLYGTSYGTFLLNRYLTLFPDQPDGVVFDSICPAGGCSLHMDRGIDGVAKTVFDACGQDAFCSARLSSEPWEKLADLQARLADGHCPAFAPRFGREALSMVIASMLDDRRLVPAAMASVYRLDRCTQEDAAAVRFLLEQVVPGAGFTLATSAPYSDFLYRHIVFSEFWRDLTPAELLAELDDLVVAPGYSYSIVDMHEAWNVPVHETPAELYRWADSSTPVLMLNGTLDTRTPIADVADMREAFSRQNQTFLEVPWGGHGSIMEGHADVGMGTCGFKLVADFLQGPTAARDTSCLDGLELLDFEGAALPSDALFGTGDLWENGVGHAIAAPPEPWVASALQRAAKRNGPPRWIR